ncbi:hypothetical protein [Candidatus Clostridium stratigraminis]|uniref:ABC-2 family transporter protein n=1 Tax=Candidatus Clostridium stratigraminis TaxID=3381661 RepID=A0ABW8T707_9CLOT
MLRKLLKYEIKATARLFLPLYLTIIIFAVINHFFLANPNAIEKSLSIYNLAMSISMIVFVFLMIGLVVMTLFVLIQRFYKNLLCDEGYLMFTLPVESWNHIFCKLITSMLWVMASSIVAFGSILLISSNQINIGEILSRFTMFFSQVNNEVGAFSYLFTLEGIILILIIIASLILTIFSAIALGQLFNKHKLLASFGMYILLHTVSQIILVLSSYIFFKSPIFRPESPFMPSTTLINEIMLITIFYFGAFAAAYFYLTNYLLKRKLNLE